MTYFIDPFGCVKNQVDAENMMAFLDNAGWRAAKEARDADLIIVNSCGFIESAKRESINAVMGWRKLYPAKKILLAGCLAQRYGKELAESLTEVDGLFGTDAIEGIVRAADKAAGKVPNGAAEDKICRGKLNAGKRPLLSPPAQAYVKISEGCNNHCSFCAIPLIRGELKSRGEREIISECKILVKRGIKELCLIGQDLGSYGLDRKGAGKNLAGILESISALEGNFRVRLLYIHPDHFPLSILDIMKKDSRLIPYFDIPFQHASTKILRAMNRRGSAKTYLDLIKTLRAGFEDAVIRSTFMTGFPGETEEDFLALLDFQKKARLDWLGCFAYSREENTKAWDMKGRPSKKTANERKTIIEETQTAITEKQMDRFVGKNYEVLIEEEFGAPSAQSREADNGDAENRLYLGRLPCQAPEVDGSAVIFSDRQLKTGETFPCRVIARRGFDLEVRIVNTTGDGGGKSRTSMKRQAV